MLLSSVRVSLLSLALLSGACSTPVDPTSVTAPRPDARAPQPLAATPVEGWGDGTDTVLTGLISDALVANPDIAIARTRLDQARALRDQSAAARQPQLDASASSARRRTGTTTASVHDLGLDASWEVDLSGRLAAADRAAQADVTSSAATLAATRLSIAGEVAVAWTQWRGLHLRRDLVAASLAAQAQTLQLTRWRAQAGLVSALDVDQALGSVEQTRAQLPALDTAIAQAEHALIVLLGGTPDATTRTALRTRLGTPTLPPVLAGLAAPDTVPAERLRRRPDVIATEATISAELARLDQTRAARRPTFRLSGSLGWQAAALSALGGSGALLATLAAAVDAPLFDAGAGATRVAAQQAVLARAQLDYQAAVQAAAQDAEDQLAALAGSRAQVQALDTAVAAARRALQDAERRYAAGLIDFTTLLDTRRTLLALDTSRASADTDARLARIRLLKALGGPLDSPTP
jgi:NodT family efflux transporter outer membrane factor (OMF) lipoprotein